MSQDAFVSHFVHDLRACLRAVETLPDWIKEDLEENVENVPKEVYQYLTGIQVSARRADRLLSDVRELCEMDKATDPVEEVDLREAVETFLQRCEQPEGISIDVNLTEQRCALPRGSFDKVMAGLLCNSVKHHNGPVGTIFITNIDTNGALLIGDDGDGIAEQFRDSVFDPFITLKPRDVVEGSGMGLTIARRRVEDWGGTLRVVTRPEVKGAVFEVTFK
ncbi:sensor histidine kinase [Sulfitobacter marinus]|uniref:sensor histidine kinase n=1 Tax=Sulfitobacter marinus TaxID=394264 RepID=UPI0015872C80|nr:HAMP domain-containing sensor histidine kinase [Sulfitobacter marinus]